jgi:hypothetical protein
MNITSIQTFSHIQGDEPTSSSMRNIPMSENENIQEKNNHIQAIINLVAISAYEKITALSLNWKMYLTGVNHDTGEGINVPDVDFYTCRAVSIMV